MTAPISPFSNKSQLSACTVCRRNEAEFLIQQTTEFPDEGLITGSALHKSIPWMMNLGSLSIPQDFAVGAPFMVGGVC